MPSTPTLATEAEQDAILKELLADLEVEMDAYQQYLVDEMVKQAGGDKNPPLQVAANKALVSIEEVKMVLKDRALVGAAGVHYVAFQLSARGYAVGITAPGVKLVDLLATNTATDKSINLQVKTMTNAKVSSKKDGIYWKWWLSEKVMSSKARTDLVLAFVDFRGGATHDWAPDVFIVPSKNLNRARASGSADGWFCLAEDRAPSHVNRWGIIEGFLN